MNDDKINELFYGKIFDERAQSVARERIHWICSQVEGSFVLDIGCSQGIVSILLGREGFVCTGIDIEKKAINYALKELKKEEEFTRQRVKFILGDATQLEFEDNVFDTVILGEIIEHFTHPEKILHEAKRVLKEGGKVIITVPFGLNSHPDHKKTYFPISFLETVRPFFKTVTIDTIHNYIIYTGRKSSHYNSDILSPKEILNEVLAVQKKVEDRSIQQELNYENNLKKFVEENRRLNQKINQISEENKHLQSQFREIQDEKQVLVDERDALRNRVVTLEQDVMVLREENKHLQSQFREIQDEKQVLVDERDALRNRVVTLEQNIGVLKRDKVSLQEKLSLVEIKLENEILTKNNALTYQENVFKRSARWRIGSFFVGGGRIIQEMILHPILFTKHFRQRFIEFARDLFPDSLANLSKKKVN